MRSESGDSIDSFFNQRDFGFARQEHVATAKNFLGVYLFQNTANESYQINGYIAMKVGKTLPEGMFFARVETKGIKNVDTIKDPANFSKEIEAAAQELKEISEKARIQKIMKEKKATFIHRSIHRDNTDQDMKVQVIFKSLKPKPTEKPKPANSRKGVWLGHLTKSETLLKVFEFEIFKVEKSIDRMLYMVLPFKIHLSGALIPTTEQRLISMDKAMSISKAASFSPCANDLQSDKESQAVLDPDQDEYLKIQNELIVYFVDNGTYNDGLKLGLKEKLDFYQNKESFYKAKIVFNVLTDGFKLSDGVVPGSCSIKLPMQKVFRKSRCLCTCFNFLSKQIVESQIQVCIDKKVLTNKDKSLNFVMSYWPGLVHTYQQLDIVIRYNLSYSVNQGSNSGSRLKDVLDQRIISCSTFDLTGTLTEVRVAPEHVEFINRLSVEKLVRDYRTISTEIGQLGFSLDFYLSRGGRHFEQRIYSTELVVHKLPEDMMSFETDYISHLFEQLIAVCDSNHDCVRLPYTEVFLSEEVKKFKIDPSDETSSKKDKDGQCISGFFI